MTADIIHLPATHARPLNAQEEQLLSRALEGWAWRVRDEGREHDADGNHDLAHSFYRMADQAQDMLNKLPWLRVTS